MEKITKTFVSYLYYGREWQEVEIPQRDLEIVRTLVDLRDITQFYFYDKSFIKDGEKIYTGEKENVSKSIFIGEKFSLDEAIALTTGETKQYLERLRQSSNGPVAICKTSRGLINMFEGDMTLDEYIETKDNSKKI